MISPRRAANKGGAQEALSASIPASTRGWNARNTLNEMPADMAAVLSNIFPTPTNIVARNGTQTYATGGFGGHYSPQGQINTLMVYRPNTGNTNQKLFAGRGTGIYAYTFGSEVVYNGYSVCGTSAITQLSTATGLAAGTTYTCTVQFDGGAIQNISVLGSTAATYAFLATAISNQITGGRLEVITGTTNINYETFLTEGGLIFVSTSTGVSSAANVVDTGAHPLMSALGLTRNVFQKSGTAAAVTGLTTNVAFSHVNVGTQGLTYLFAANGFDNMRRYDSTNGWVDTSLNGAGQQITGLPNGVSSVIYVTLVHTRLFFVTLNSNIIYFLGAAAIAGAVSNLDLGPLLSKGGNIIAAGGWSTDSGIGMQEYTVFISNQGQAVVYQGIDPSNAALWQLVGVYDIGRPVGRQIASPCLLRYGDDLLILTTDGIVPASKAFRTGQTDKRVAVTTNIQNAVVQAINTSGPNSQFWGMHFYPDAQYLLLNIPAQGKQFVMNTQHRAWCQFSGWQVTAFANLNDVNTGFFADLMLYSNVGGDVILTTTDTFFSSCTDVETGDMTAEWVPAFNYLRGEKYQLKEVSMTRPNMTYGSAVFSMVSGIDADFVIQTPTGAVNLPILSSGQGVKKSNFAAQYSGDPATRMLWLTASAIGIAVAPHYLFTFTEDQALGQVALSLSSIDAVFTLGGIQSS